MEPRQIRQRSSAIPEIASRPISEELLIEPKAYRLPPDSPSRRRSNFAKRLAVSAVALLALAGAGLGLSHFIQQSNASADTARSTRDAPSDLTAIVDPSSSLAPVGSPPPVTPAPGDAPPATPVEPANDTPAPTPAPFRPNAGTLALACLEKFLAASNLEARLPLIETQLSHDQLQKTILASPFPSDPQIEMDIQEANPSGGFIDLYYGVTFKQPETKNPPQLILVRVRGEEDAKIVVDPFLDTYGGRLAAFAATPSEKSESFQVVVSAVARVTADRNIPNHENKLRLKLLPKDNEKEITNAYFAKLSKIGKMLATEGSGFRYGQARTAIVVLRWNTGEDPGQPFLEAIDIKGFRWNP